jgi:hypothetical protein
MQDKTPADDAGSILSLDQLRRGSQCITEEYGGSLAQAAIICLDNQNHSCGVKLQVRTETSFLLELRWSVEITEAARRTWRDLNVAVEHGAYGLAFLLVRSVTGLSVIERSVRGWSSPRKVDTELRGA